MHTDRRVHKLPSHTLTHTHSTLTCTNAKEAKQKILLMCILWYLLRVRIQKSTNLNTTITHTRSQFSAQHFRRCKTLSLTDSIVFGCLLLPVDMISMHIVKYINCFLRSDLTKKITSNYSSENNPIGKLLASSIICHQ